MAYQLYNENNEPVYPNTQGYGFDTGPQEYTLNIIRKAIDDSCCIGNPANSGFGVTPWSQLWNRCDDCFLPFFKGNNTADFNIGLEFVTIYCSELNNDCINDNGQIRYEVAKSLILDKFNRLITNHPNRLWCLAPILSYNGNLPQNTNDPVDDTYTNNTGGANYKVDDSDDGWRFLSYPLKLYNYLKQQDGMILFKDWHGNSGKKTINTATLDYRNDKVLSFIEDYLNLLDQCLKTEIDAPDINTDTDIPKGKVTYGDYVYIINPGVVGPWGEGNSNEIYYNIAKYRDSEPFIKVFELFKKYFSRYYIVANTFGMRTDTTKPELKDYQWYLLTTTYGSKDKDENGYYTGDKQFGLYQAHIFNNDTQRDLSISKYWNDDEHDFAKIAFQKYKVAPVIGETNIQAGAVPGILEKWHFSEFYTFMSTELSVSGLSLISYIARYYFENIGPRIVFYSSRGWNIKSNGFTVCLTFLNIGNSPVYKDYISRFKIEFVARDANGKLIEVGKSTNEYAHSTLFSDAKYINNFYNLKEEGTSKIDDVYPKTMTLYYDVTFTQDVKSQNILFRFVDTKHILNNFMLANKDVTPDGEYIIQMKSQSVQGSRNINFYKASDDDYVLSPNNGKNWTYTDFYASLHKFKLYPAYKRGYVFNGWYKEGELINKVEEIPCMDNPGTMNLYPKFIKIQKD